MSAPTHATHVACPYCGQAVGRFTDYRSARAREVSGEEGDCCFLPFDVDEHGDGIGQDGERAALRVDGTPVPGRSA